MQITAHLLPSIIFSDILWNFFETILKKTSNTLTPVTLGFNRQKAFSAENI
jgi:hypothetical protein